MWNRKILKEEAKKVFTFSQQNYWKLVLAGLIVVLLSGGLSGTISGFFGSITGTLTGGKAAKQYNKERYTSVGVEKDVVEITDENGKTTKIRIHGIGDPSELEKEIKEEVNDAIQDRDMGDYGTWNNRNYDIDVTPSIFEGLFGVSVALAVVMITVLSLFVTAIGLAFKAFLINPIILGCKSCFLNTYERPADLKDLGNGFKNQYMKNVGTLLLRDIFTMLWTLLLIVPGIIKAYEYRMIPYLIAENPNMSYKEAFAKSKEMMMGNKWEAFVLDLSFLGWFLLNCLTCGILGVFYVSPYYYATDANLYRAIKMGGDTGFVSRDYPYLQAQMAGANATVDVTNCNAGSAPESTTASASENAPESAVESTEEGTPSNDNSES